VIAIAASANELSGFGVARQERASLGIPALPRPAADRWPRIRAATKDQAVWWYAGGAGPVAAAIGNWK
jgi:hypothetical protein